MFFTYGELIKRRRAGDPEVDAIEDLICVKTDGIDVFHRLHFYPDVYVETTDVLSEYVFMDFEQFTAKKEAPRKIQNYIR